MEIPKPAAPDSSHLLTRVLIFPADGTTPYQRTVSKDHLTTLWMQVFNAAVCHKTTWSNSPVFTFLPQDDTSAAPEEHYWLFRNITPAASKMVNPHTSTANCKSYGDSMLVRWDAKTCDFSDFVDEKWGSGLRPQVMDDIFADLGTGGGEGEWMFVAREWVKGLKRERVKGGKREKGVSWERGELWEGGYRWLWRKVTGYQKLG